MTVEIEEISAIEKKITITIRPEVVDKNLDSAYKNLGKRVKIKGFRQGKIPRSILERYYKDQVNGEVITQLVNDSYFKALDEHGIMPVAQPVIDNAHLEKGKEFTYSAKVEVRPEIQVKEYVGMEIQKEKASVTDEDVEKRLAELQQSNAQLQEIDEPRPVQTGDYVIIDYEGFDGDNPIEGANVSDHQLEVGSGTFTEEFEKQLLGLTKGDQKDVKITLPEDYRTADLAGKEITYKVNLKGIKEKLIPELGDDFAKDLGEFETLDELRENIRENLTKTEELRAEARLRENVLKKIVENNPFELPSSMVDQHLEYMINEIQMKLSLQGLTVDQVGLSTEGLSEQYREQAEKEVRGSLLLEEIAKKEAIEVTEEDIEDRITSMAEMSGQEVDTLRDYYKENSARQRLKNGMATEKTLDFIVNKATIEEVERGKDDAHSDSD